MSAAASDSLPLVAVVMGSKSDYEVMTECAMHLLLLAQVDGLPQRFQQPMSRPSAPGCEV
jgi:hypothetical protein